MAAQPAEMLTEREIEVLDLLARGHSDADMQYPPLLPARRSGPTAGNCHLDRPRLPKPYCLGRPGVVHCLRPLPGTYSEWCTAMMKWVLLP
jgi:hypothetical protein